MNGRSYDASCTLKFLHIEDLCLICLAQSVNFIIFAGKVIYS